jgi:glycosyltransferase involved in cell wall biosynthesis
MMGVERLAHGVDLTINTIGVYGGKQFCRTDIVYVHGVGRGTVEYPWWKLPYALPYELMMLANRRLAARRPRSMFIANSRYTERKLLSCCGIQASRIIYPPVHTEVYRKLLTEKKRQDLAITIGRYSPERQLESIIGIAKRIRLGLRFVVIGYASKPSEFAILRSLLAQADQFGLPIDFLMNETQERKQELIAQAKVVIQPSRMEHFGIALCEAISGGCLPVTINDGGHLEVLETLGPLAQIYGNYEEAARAVESAMDSWSLKHAKRASEQMEQFNMQRFSQQICQFIEEFDL